MSKINGFTSFLNNPNDYSLKTTPVSTNQNESVSNASNNQDKKIETVKVDLKDKPQDTNAGEFLLRQALNKVASKYGLNSSDVELEIVTRQQNNQGFSTKHDKYTNEQLAKDIETGSTKINFSLPESMIAKMQERKEVLRFIAEKEAYGRKLTEQDYAQLEQFGYSKQDIANLRQYKLMEYGGFQAKFKAAQLNSELRQKMVKDELAKLQERPDSDFYVEGNEKISPDFERRRIANEIVNRQLDGKTSFEYLRDKKDEDDFQKRLESKSFGDYLSSGSKSLINSFYYSIGDGLKGIAVLANGIRRYDEDGNKLDNNASEAPIYKFGEWIQQNVQAPGVDKDIERTIFGGKVPQTVGTVLPYLLGSWVTATPKATTAILAGLSTGGAVYDEAKQKGATEAEAQKTAILTGGFLGVTSVIGYGKTLEALNKGAGATTWRNIFNDALKDGTRNAIVAGGQTIGENAIAKGIYDNNRGYLDNVRERMIAAGITGSALKGGIEVITRVRAGKNQQTLTETQKTLNVKPPEVTNAKVSDLQVQGNNLKAKLNAKVETSVEKTNRLAKQEAVKTINQAKKNEPVITKDLQNISKETSGELVGFDKRFKTEDSLTRKFADRTQRDVIKAEKRGKNINEVRTNALNKIADKNNDALRYTYEFTAEKYADGYNQTIKALEKQGYKLVQSDNYWLTKGTEKDTGYRGINTTFIAPNGQKFEVQFHTNESFKFKNDNHYLYEETRKPNISEERKRELKQQNIKLAEPIVMPKNFDKILDVRIQK